MEDELMVRWPEDLGEYVFTNNCSLITCETIEEALEKDGLYHH